MQIDNLSIVVPVHNEEASLPQLLKEFKQVLPKLGIPYELIFIEDGSQDRSKQILEEENQLNLKLVPHPKKQGYGASLKDGIRASSFDHICILDADCAYPPHLILKAIHEIRDADILIGARDEWSKSFPLSQKVARFLISSTLSLIFRKVVKDINSGFRLFKRDKIKAYLDLLPDGFSFTASLTLLMLLENLNFRYIPISVRKRIGVSKVRRTSYTFQFLKCLLSTFLRWARIKTLK